MSSEQTTAAPDPVRVARKTCAEMWPAETEAYLCGHLDKSPAMETAIKTARAMQEAMSAQGGGDRRYGPYPVAWMGAGVWAGIPDELPPELYGRQVYVVPVARPAPEVQDAPEAVRDVILSLTQIAGVVEEIGTTAAKDAAQAIREDIAALEGQPTTPAPAASDELVERLRAGGWSVAVHNDYRLSGEPCTFWLWTHPNGRWVKGEGRSDLEALQQCTEAVDLIEADTAEMERKDARIAELEGDCRSYAKTMEAIEKADARDQALIRDLEARATAAEAGRDALREAVEFVLDVARERDEREIGYRADLWDVLRAGLAHPALRPEAKGGRE